MKKEKWKAFTEKLKEKSQFLKLDDDDIDLEDEMQMEEEPLSAEKLLLDDTPEENLEERLARNRKWVFRRRLAIVVLLAAIAGGFVLYNQFHTFEDYIIAKSYEKEASSGTQYKEAGKNLYRYNSDGISCVTRENELKWSITYNMQAPIVDVCDTTMAVAEQQGNQVYVVNKDGLVGSFETLLPILKVRVSHQGVVAVVLQEENVTWVNLYQADGTSIANTKVTMTESGYPLDIDLSPNGQKLAVSYLSIEGGRITSNVVFYNFGAAGQADNDHVVGRQSYAEQVIPEIYFTDNTRAVAVADNGFKVFKGNDEFEQTHEEVFEKEIMSTFHDGETIGFLFESEEDNAAYHLEMYNYRGRKKAERNINAEFEHVKMQNGQILMYGIRNCEVFTSSGQHRFSSAYEKDIEDIFYFSEFRKYLVITDDSFDQIRIS